MIGPEYTAVPCLDRRAMFNDGNFTWFRRLMVDTMSRVYIISFFSWQFPRCIPWNHAATCCDMRHGDAVPACATVQPADIALALAMGCHGKPRGIVHRKPTARPRAKNQRGKSRDKFRHVTRGNHRDEHYRYFRGKCRDKFHGKCRGKFHGITLAKCRVKRRGTCGGNCRDKYQGSCRDKCLGIPRGKDYGKCRGPLLWSRADSL